MPPRRGRTQNQSSRFLTDQQIRSLRHLTIERVSSLHEAVEIFGGGLKSSNDIPLLCVIRGGFCSKLLSCCLPCACKAVSVPTGIFTMGARFGKYTGEMGEGCHCLMPWTEVQYAVTQHYIPYVVPVKQCPTKDNVYVTIEMMIVFRIIEPEAFVFTMGPTKLEMILVGFIEEGIRDLANDTDHLDVLDLRGQRNDAMISALNKVLMKHGVEIHSAAISNVALPLELGTSLENATLYASKTSEHLREHHYREMTAMDTHKEKDVDQRRDNERAAVVADHFRNLGGLQKITSEVYANTEKEVAEIGAVTEKEVNIIDAQSDVHVAKLDGQKDVEVTKIKAEGEKEAAVILSEQSAYTVIKDSEARLNVAEDHAHTVTLMGDAEEKAGPALRSKREFIRHQAHLDVLQNLARNPNTRVIGSTGGNDLAQIAGTGALKGATLAITADGSSASSVPRLPRK